jgi:hypothetical protein
MKMSRSAIAPVDEPNGTRPDSGKRGPRPSRSIA